MLDANNATSTFPMQMQGRLDGENAVKLGEGFMFKKFLEWDPKDRSDDKNLREYIQEIVFEEARKLKWDREHADDDHEEIEFLNS